MISRVVPGHVVDFENDELVLAQHFGDGTRAVLYIGQVGLALAAERRWNRDKNGIGLAKLIQFAGCAKALGLQCLNDRLVRYMSDSAFASVQQLNTLAIDIEANNPEPRFQRHQSKGKADITKPHDANRKIAALDFVQQRLQVSRCWGFRSVHAATFAIGAVLRPARPLRPAGKRHKTTLRVRIAVRPRSRRKAPGCHNRSGIIQPSEIAAHPLGLPKPGRSPVPDSRGHR